MDKNLDDLMQKVKIAQEKYAGFSQEMVDKIFYHVAVATNTNRIVLAKEVVDETGMGVVEDKVIKNHFAAEFVFNKYRDVRTCGIFDYDEAMGIYKEYAPVGIIIGIVPVTNPTSTIIFKTLLALKTRNVIIFSPHPRAKNSCKHCLEIILKAAIEAGAPENIVSWVENPTVELTGQLMSHPLTNLVLATGGPGLVKAAYSSGTPAIGVGPGNVPVVIDKSADIDLAVSSIIISKAFDNGTICASEQAIVCDGSIYDEVKSKFIEQKVYLLNKEEKEKLRKVILKNGKINAAIAGQYAYKIADFAGFKVPKETKILLAETNEVGEREPLSYEKLSPILAMYKSENYEDSVKLASKIIAFGGMGHTSVLHVDEKNKDMILEFSRRIKTARILINSPGAQGAIGDVYNFKLNPSLTLGCGSWGRNSIAENITVKHLLNIKTVAIKRENMLWFQVPEKIYFKYGCVSEALTELKGLNRAMIITSPSMIKYKYIDRVLDNLKKYNIDYKIFSEIPADPDIEDVYKGNKILKNFNPDLIIAMGGGSVMDAAKIMWLLYEHPKKDFEDLSMRFMDIRKRVYKFQKLGLKAKFVAIPTTSGTGSEVTPFAVITDKSKNAKYPIADYELTPDIAIIDPEFVMTMPKNLTAASGIDAVSHSLEAIVSVVATEYTDGLALESLKILFKYLPLAYKDPKNNLKAREQVHYGATIAGMSFANAFLGVCHAMAHSLGGIFHVPHGVANALLLPHVIRYNSEKSFSKFTIFSQYIHPISREKYAAVADFLNLGGKNIDAKIENLIKALEKLKKELDLPKTIVEAGVNKKDFEDRLDELTYKAFDDQCLLTNPRYPLLEEIKKLYLKLL